MADEIARSMDQPLRRRLCGDGICDPERIPSVYAAEHRLIYETIVTGDEDAAMVLVERIICSACARTFPRANRDASRLLAAST